MGGVEGWREGRGHVLYAVWVNDDPALLVCCSRCGACQQSLPRRLMLQCTSFLEWQADVRSRRALPVGAHGGTESSER